LHKKEETEAESSFGRILLYSTNGWKQKDERMESQDNLFATLTMKIMIFEEHKREKLK
jgi:hypothetical protein